MFLNLIGEQNMGNARTQKRKERYEQKRKILRHFMIV